MPVSEVQVFNTCCHCMSLRTGCFIIGYCLLAFYAPALVLLALLMLLNILRVSMFQYPDFPFFWVFMTIQLMYFAAELAFAIVLLVGLHKLRSLHVTSNRRRRGHLLVFLIGVAIIIVLRLLTLVGTIFCNHGPWHITSRLIFLAFDIINFIFVISYFYKMDEEDANADAT